MLSHLSKIIPWTNLIIAFIYSGIAYADSSTHSKGGDALYNQPVVKEATIDWPEPHPDENLYLDSDPDYIKALESDRPLQTVINTQKFGRHHFITVTLVGLTGARLDVQIMIDTGASIVVLPESLMSDLGIGYEQTYSRKVQTVNGITDALFARIDSIEIGDETVQDINVAFINDASLGGVKLLGMNILRNFKVTLDDKNRTLTLRKSE